MLHAFQYNHEILIYGEYFRTNNQHTQKSHKNGNEPKPMEVP